MHLVLKQWPEVTRKGQGMETQCLRKTQGLRDQKKSHCGAAELFDVL